MNASPSDQARWIAIGRIGFGALALLAPGRQARTWFGRDIDRPGGRFLLRSGGGRDIALGLGTLAALRRGTAVRGWVEAAALADGADVLGTLVAWRSLPRGRRFVLLVGAAGLVAVQAALAPRVDEPAQAGAAAE